MTNKTVIIGGVAGGATTATRLRRLDGEREIVMFERGEYISYANCGLPYYIGNVIEDRDALLIMTPELMKARYDVDVRTSSEVIKIVPDEKKIVVTNKISGETYEETYDELVLATGSSPIKPPIPGINADNIFTLWTIPDTDAIKGFIKSTGAKRAAVIGGGFIGLEMAENLHHLGMEVSIIEMQNQVMAPIDLEMANLVHENVIRNNINLILGDGVKEFHNSEGHTTIELGSGKQVEADLIILSIGIRPNSELAKEAGLAVNQRGGIVVDDYMKTSVDHIYAVGDVIEVTNYVTQERTMIPLAGPANKQGRILADNLTGEHKAYKGTLGTSVVKVFDLDIAAVGLNEKQLLAAGKVKDQDYYTTLIIQKSHAGYYPGATQLTLKMIFSPEGKIYGGQIVGQEGVAKRIDTLATTMRLDGTIYNLQELELAYAPPFSAAKDPVNMLGYVAANILERKISFMEVSELEALMADESRKDDFIILDVLEDVEREVCFIPNSVHIPFGQVRERMNELDKSKLIITYCAIGVRSYNAARILRNNGFKNVCTLAGGLSFYKSMHYSDNMSAKSLEEGKPVAEMKKVEKVPTADLRILNCSGLQCPGPIMKVSEAIKEMNDGDMIRVSATDMGFASDVQSWCKRTGNTYVNQERDGKDYIVTLAKGSDEVKEVGTGNVELPQGKTMVVFSGDLDKAIASFIIANGAASMGRKVTMFFTFWGLNILRKPEGSNVKKTALEKMFGKMMPQGVNQLKLSQMNMGGIGTKMIKKVMKDKNVDTLETLMETAMKNGVKLVACTMTMDLLGIKEEELIDGANLGGVATYLGDAEESNVNLFI